MLFVAKFIIDEESDILGRICFGIRGPEGLLDVGFTSPRTSVVTKVRRYVDSFNAIGFSQKEAEDFVRKNLLGNKRFDGIVEFNLTYGGEEELKSMVEKKLCKIPTSSSERVGVLSNL